jgi:hypothetical protein
VEAFPCIIVRDELRCCFVSSDIDGGVGFSGVEILRLIGKQKPDAITWK